MSGAVYHFTDTARLPWIILDGTLKPGNFRIGGLPMDFLWATVSPLGDRTASASMQGLRDGRVRLVRFTLRAEDFEPWPEILEHFPAWKPEHIAALESTAAGKSRPQDWRCRAESLSILGQDVLVETRSYTDKVWRPVELRAEFHSRITASVTIGDRTYVSTKGIGPQGQDAFSVQVLHGGLAA